MSNADKTYHTEGMTIAPGVIETIVAMAAAEVEGVAGVGTAGAFAQIMAAFNAGKPIPTAGVEINVDETKNMTVEITIQAFYGKRLIELADSVRNAIGDALRAQIGIEVAAVDVYIDALVFDEKA